MYLFIGILCLSYVAFVGLLILALCKAACRGDEKDDEAYYAMTGHRNSGHDNPGIQ
jgi:hypothetical protein